MVRNQNRFNKSLAAESDGRIEPAAADELSAEVGVAESFFLPNQEEFQ